MLTAEGSDWIVDFESHECAAALRDFDISAQAAGVRNRCHDKLTFIEHGGTVAARIHMSIQKNGDAKNQLHCESALR